MSQHNHALLQASDLRFATPPKLAIVATEWNHTIVEAQLAGAYHVLGQYQATVLPVVTVPGCFEIPFAARQLSLQSEFSGIQAIIAFGAVIRGGTPHFEYVCKAVTDGVLQLNLQSFVPIIFGVLTVDHEDQAWERLGGPHGHKGEEAALSALKMISLRVNGAYAQR
jgi:6,7-dimethyl-8-ribityllumazine synthase